MAGVSGVDMAAAVSAAGGLGSIPCATLGGGDAVRAAAAALRQALTARGDDSGAPFALNFFCHNPPPHDEQVQAAWRAKLAPYYAELGVDPEGVDAGGRPSREPFDDDACAAVQDVRPAVVSFHFGLPSQELLKRVKDAGCVVVSSATTVAEARWLADAGADVIVAQGAESGGHVGSFLCAGGNAATGVARHAGTLALVPQVVDAVGANVPVVAAGGIGDGRGFASALALGASGVQVGTAFLLTAESQVTAPHRKALQEAADDSTAVTNVLTGRPARGIITRLMAEMGPLSDDVPPFPTAATAVGPLKAAAEARGSGAFSAMWAGQAAPLLTATCPGASHAIPTAFDVATGLADGALHELRRLSQHL